MTDDTATHAPGFDRHMLEALVCPVTHTLLHYDPDRQELVSRAAGLAFPIRQGIPIMLIDEARQIKADDDRPQG
ncbi:Trm112 family protein [uncultured Paracoccus sp.]|uniref:Trm112 family protein n=1 Tax=uncultured Paracoccus sp. TaxID=189685 RepID=UPI0026360800|nr:Trm112 family protein [uncultured Paracoccus sp.]